MAALPPDDADVQHTATNTVADETPSAVHRVFNITELLERILLQVIWDDDYHEDGLDKPLQTVLLSQRVSKTFNATINGSITILRSLWLLQPFDDNFTEDDNGFNPLLVNKCGTLQLNETTDYAAKLSFSRIWRRRSRYSIHFHPRVSGVQAPAESSASWKRMHIVSSDKMLRRMRAGVFVDEDCTSAGRTRYFGDVKIQFDDAGKPSLIELVKKAWEAVTSK